VLDASPNAQLIDLTITQLYENQLLVEGLHPNPATIVSRIQNLMTIAADAVRRTTGTDTAEE
jgi:molecular chaperone HtpG